MKRNQSPLAGLLLAAGLLSPWWAHATNGYFSAGYGIKSQGIAGIGVALPQDALAAASNPAGTAWVGNRTDLGLTLFKPDRGAEIVNSGNAPANGSYDGNGKNLFLIPDFGYTAAWDARHSYGLAVYGNGGMNTDYARNPYQGWGAQGSAGVNLEQLFITPSIAFKPQENYSIGVAAHIAYQRFSAKGLGIFGPSPGGGAPTGSVAPGQVSDQGTDASLGVGLSLGWLHRFDPQWTVGANWSSRIKGRFDRYKGLFANQGEFDVPENWALGLTYQPRTQTQLAVEYQKIRYSGVAAVGNSADKFFEFGGSSQLGGTDGPGFGWGDVGVWKFGITQAIGTDLTLRGGFSHSSQPIRARETLLGILAPGTIQKHVTVGATWNLNSGQEVSAFYARGLAQKVLGNQSIPTAFGGGNANIHLKEDIAGVSYAWKF